MTTPPVARNSKRGTSATASNILDAAESLFAVRGFYGASVRDITQAAGAQLAMVNYHFGSKQELYVQVIRRRGTAHAGQMQRFLDEAVAAASGGPPSIESVIEAFCASIFERIVNGGPGWRRYIQLLSRIADAPQEEGFVAPMNELFDPVVGNYVKALRAALPEMSNSNLYAAFYFLQAGLVYTTADTRGIDRQSGGKLHSGDFQKLLPRMVRFFAAGFRSLDALPRNAVQKKPRRKRVKPR